MEIDIPYPEIRHATGNFNGNFIIGTGENGTVYKGRGLDGCPWAVKRAEAPVVPATQEFLREVISNYKELLFSLRIFSFV